MSVSAESPDESATDEPRPKTAGAAFEMGRDANAALNLARMVASSAVTTADTLWHGPQGARETRLGEAGRERRAPIAA